ncbi:MAG: hypothetical protein ACK5MD_09990 [Flavobacteriales bacterium]
MARINLAEHKGENIDAFEVDDNYEMFDKELFKCPECGVKVQYNRGINHKDPHFKNWPKIKHLDGCEILKVDILYREQSDEVKSIVSTILPRAERLNKLDSLNKIRRARKRYFGKRSKKFLSALVSLTDEELKTIVVRTEDKKTVRLHDLILRQDSIIEKLNQGNESFVCILKAFTSKPIDVGNNIKVPMTFGGRYGNTNRFDLFIPASYKEKNEKKLDSISNKLIYCYGIPEKNAYGYKMDLYSITHQIVVIK